MHIKTGGASYPCRDYKPGKDTVRYSLAGDAVPSALGKTVELWQDDPALLLSEQTVGDYLRWEVSGNTLTLTDLPVPEPTPAPEPMPDPGPDELTLTQLAVAELAQVVEENNTAAQLAIAELAETVLGGTT